MSSSENLDASEKILDCGNYHKKSFSHVRTVGSPKLEKYFSTIADNKEEFNSIQNKPNSKEYDQLIIVGDEKQLEPFSIDQFPIIENFLEEEDINIVMDQTSCNRISAVNALIRHNYDLISAIMELTE